MGDQEIVYANCREAQAAGREIDHATARVIGSWWAAGSVDCEYAFASTGAIVGGATNLWRSLTCNGSLYDAAGPDDKLALDMLGTYLMNRDDTGPVPGWSGLWVRA